MSEVFKFFKNATKALFLSPLYLLFFVWFLIRAIALYFYGEYQSFIGMLTRKGYDKKETYIYERRLKLCKEKNTTFDVLKEQNKRANEANE